MIYSIIDWLPLRENGNHLFWIFLLLVILCLGSALIVFYLFSFFKISQKVCGFMAQVAGILGAIFWFYLIF